MSVSGAATASFVYDANGNLLERAGGGVTWSYAWNGDNRLAGVNSNPLTGRQFNAYDADGKLVWRFSQTWQPAYEQSVTHYPWPHYEVEKDAGAGGGDITTRYYLVEGQRLILRRTSDADPSRNGRFTIHADHLGSTSVVMDGQLQKVDELRYYPFGEAYAGDPDAATTDYAYTGQRWSGYIGLYYYGARW